MMRKSQSWLLLSNEVFLQNTLRQRCRGKLLLVILSGTFLTMYFTATTGTAINDIEANNEVAVSWKKTEQSPIETNQTSNNSSLNVVPTLRMNIVTTSTANPAEMTLEDFLSYNNFTVGYQTRNFSKTPWFQPEKRYTYDFYPSITPQRSYYNLRYLFVVTSSLRNFDRRMVIRETWGDHLKKFNDSKLVFLVGDPVSDPLQRKILKEAQEFDDLLQYSFAEDYMNLTLKSIMLLGWAGIWQPTFLVKVDDDIMVNLELFRSKVEIVYSQMPQFVAGFGLFDAVVSRSKISKWYVSKQEYADRLFPNYVAGMLYVIPGRLTRAFYRTAHTVRPFKFEDVFVTGMLATKLNVTRIGLPQMKIVTPELDCEMVNLVAVHANPDSMTNLYKVLMNTNEDCEIL